MKYFLILLTFFTATLHAQSGLKFNKRFVQCEDKWVAFPMSEDSTISYGFIYIDPTAGLTMEQGGSFTISETGRFVQKFTFSTSVKLRLEANNVQVAIIPENRLAELKVAAIPEWLKYYKKDTANIERLFKWGFMYNGWDECAKALTYLEKADAINPQFKGLAVELAFSYNCLKQYDKAMLVLQRALEADSTDAYTNKELIYAQSNAGQLDKAAESCRKAIAICKDKTYFGESCYNVLHACYEKEDKANFKIWLVMTKKWAANNENIMLKVKEMEKEMAK
jgi:tetratricopeptide (TPR) repeat protein